MRPLGNSDPRVHHRTGVFSPAPPPEGSPFLADDLRRRFDARPELILAEDTRAEGGAFTLRYLFELPGVKSILVATARGYDWDTLRVLRGGGAARAALHAQEGTRAVRRHATAEQRPAE